MSLLDAFNDFLEWIKDSGKWDKLTPQQKNRIITARRDRDFLRGIPLGPGRIKRILSDYAPGRYSLTEEKVHLNK